MKAYLTIKDGRLVLEREGRADLELRHVQDLAYADFEGRLFCSSTVDFPEEYTEDAAVIALCRQLRDDPRDRPVRGRARRAR